MVDGKIDRAANPVIVRTKLAPHITVVQLSQQVHSFLEGVRPCFRIQIFHVFTLIWPQNQLIVFPDLSLLELKGLLHTKQRTSSTALH